MNIVHAVITRVTSFAAAFVAAWIMGFVDPANTEDEARAPSAPSTPRPAAGRDLPLAEVSDAMISQKVMGDGLAIQPSDGTVYAPFDAARSTHCSKPSTPSA